MKKIIHILIACGTLAMSGCIEETFPTEFATESQVAESPMALNALVSAIPTAMIGWENEAMELCNYPGLCAAFEEMTEDVVIAGYTGYNTWATYSRMSNPTHVRQNYAWYMYYAYIKNTNNVIGLIDAGTQDRTQQTYLGIAHAFRAFYYLNMVRMFEYKYTPYCPPENDGVYGLGVPIVTEETTEEQAKNNPRVTVAENYEMIFADLAKAEEYLKGYVQTAKSFPSLACVYGLYARAWLERGTAGVAGAYEKAAEYARRAINECGYTPMTQEKWQDPVNGFNDADFQNWMWGVCITPDNVSMMGDSFYGLLMVEQTWTAYGWRVGRSASRKFYEAIPDNDFRKYSWLDPVFYAYGDRPVSNSYNGHEYKLAMPADEIRKGITVASQFYGLPWIYNPIKFRPADNGWGTQSVGAAMDYPIMRVEEMYLIEAEAVARTKGVSDGIRLLNDFMRYRIFEGSYDCAPKSGDLESFVTELIFQKRVEFWGEGVNYYDAKRLALGLHRGYKGINASQYFVTYDLDGIFPLWNCRIPESEKQGNPAMILNPTPLTAVALDLYWAKSNADLTRYYGCDLNNPDGE
ncbi:MAG: RagB/SusD family nutrient uptake outer membrane protein [Tannerella sp.]|jgi:hypothetical protein|nr:RagB/SusD family nutrient uptake outer membrane protein [Tannerella sp.]